VRQRSVNSYDCHAPQLITALLNSFLSKPNDPRYLAVPPMRADFWHDPQPLL